MHIIQRFFIHDDLSIELIIDNQHALLPPSLVEEILEALDEKTQTDDEEEIQEDNQQDES